MVTRGNIPTPFRLCLSLLLVAMSSLTAAATLQLPAVAKIDLTEPAVTHTVIPAPASAPETAPAPAATAPLPADPKPTLRPTPQPRATPKPGGKAAAAAAPADLAPLSACPSQNDITQTGPALLCLTNYARSQHGLGVIASNGPLSQAAEAKAKDIAECGDFSHTACGRPADYYVKTSGYKGRCSGENIAQGQPNPRVVFTSWMNSAGHRANILNPNYTDMGVAWLNSPSGPIWVMQLGGCS